MEQIMIHITKLKPLNEWWVGLIYIGNGVMILISAVLGFFYSYLNLLGYLFIFVVLLNLIIALRMGNLPHLAGALHYSVFSALLISVSADDKIIVTSG